MTIRIPLNDLGLTDEKMLELVNRMNEADDRKWVLTRTSGCGQMRNTAMDHLQPYSGALASGASNPQ